MKKTKHHFKLIYHVSTKIIGRHNPTNWIDLRLDLYEIIVYVWDFGSKWMDVYYRSISNLSMLYIPNDTSTYKYIVLSIAYRRHFVQRRRRLLPQRPSTPRSFYRRELTTKETWHQKILHQTYVPLSTSRELFHRSGWQSSARRQVRAQCHIIAVLSLPPSTGLLGQTPCRPTPTGHDATPHGMRSTQKSKPHNMWWENNQKRRSLYMWICLQILWR